jgi:hypothetical protein
LHLAVVATTIALGQQVKQRMSMRISAGAFNTREFVHGKSLALVRYVKALLVAFAFALPIVPALISIAAQSAVALFATIAVQ